MLEFCDQELECIGLKDGAEDFAAGWLQPSKEWTSDAYLRGWTIGWKLAHQTVLSEMLT